MRAKQKLLALKKAKPLRLHPDELQHLFAVRTDRPHMRGRFLEIQFLCHIATLAERPQSAARDLGLSIRTDFIASPLHCLVRWTPDFGRPDKVKPPGWEAPYQEDDDVGKATRVWGSV